MDIVRKYHDRIDETEIVATHPSGLKIHIIPKKDYSKKFAYFFTRYGALHNDFVDLNENVRYEMPFGIAHFLEHKLFENPENGVFQRFSNLGANVNAFTNFVTTAYTFSTVENFYECLGILVDFVQHPHLTDENVEKEKGIIAQEIKMYEDDADWISYFNMLKSMYKNHPIKNDIAGTVESVMDTTREDLLKCYNSFYTPDNMALVIVGDVDEEKVYESVESSLTEEFKKRKLAVSFELPFEPQDAVRKHMEANLDISQPSLAMGYKLKSHIEDDVRMGKGHVEEENVARQMRRSFAVRIILDSAFGRGSEFFQSAYDDGIINATFGYDYNYGTGYSFIMFSCETDEHEKAAQAIRDEIARIKLLGTSRESFDLAKRKNIGKFIGVFNSTKYLSSSYLSHIVKGSDLFSYLDVLEALTYEDASSIFHEEMTDIEVVSLVRRKGEY
jgi:predicted Zn-dependent peptidase